MNSSKFLTALTFTLQWEGGYANHPADRGGPTMKGITFAVYNKYRRSKGLPIQSVLAITEAEIKEIYRINYWNLIAGDLFEAPLGLVLFDYAVNSGPKRAIKALQGILKVEADGEIGDITFRKICSQDQRVLAHTLLGQRERFVRSIVEANPSQGVFLKGWLNRLTALSKALEAA